LDRAKHVLMGLKRQAAGRDAMFSASLAGDLERTETFEIERD
jgi:hypothetical protein